MSKLTLAEIDELLAEKVMGWTRYHPLTRKDGWDAEEFQKFYEKGEWHPSTDIAQAFMVVEKLVDTDHSPYGFSCARGTRWIAEFWTNKSRWEPYWRKSPRSHLSRRIRSIDSLDILWYNTTKGDT